jgi:hypothetical protein
MILLDHFCKMATIDHWTMIENTCIGLHTYNLLVFMVGHNVDTEGDLSAPEFDEELSEDDYLHIQTSSCTIASRHVSIDAYASYVYKNGHATLHSVSFERGGTCAACRDGVTELCDDIPAWWQTEYCEECHASILY